MYYQPQLTFALEELLVYLRKSQSDDPTLTVEEVLEKHERMIDEWTERFLGGKVAEHCKYREVVSGETIKDRPGIQQILRMIESPKIKGVVIVEPQRLTRGDGEEIGRLMKLFKYTDTKVITPQRIYDLRDEYDWDAFKRELERGNDYLEYTKKILNRGRLLSVSQGNFLGNYAPYGYDKAWVMDGKRKCPTLKENKEQADVVRMIFDMYANQDIGVNIICNHLDGLGIKPPRGEHWSADALRDMITNVHYIGKVRWNWRKAVTIVEDGEIIKTRPKSQVGEFLVYEGKHEGIISEELFNRAQEKRGKNPKIKPNTQLRNALAGIIFCQCGRAMTYRTYNRKDGTERCTPRLLCNGQVHCGTGSYEYGAVIERVCQVLEQCIEDFEIRLSNDTGDSAKLHAKLIKGLEKKQEELEKKELAQWEQQAHPDPEQRMPPHIFKALNEKLLREKEEIKQALCNAYESMPEPVDYGERIVRFKDALDALRNPDVDVKAKNTLLKQCIEKIEYKRDKPQRTKGKGVGETGAWTNPPFEINVTLKI